MAESAYVPGVLIQSAETPRHSAIVRLTHWINAFSFFGLLISGIAILIAHPRLYWGETGSVETPALINLPLPFVLKGQNGWGRSLHFLSAWACVLNGLLYALSGFFSAHFRKNVMPAKTDLTWKSLSDVFADLRPQPQGAEPSGTYSVHQRLMYTAVVFVLFPVMIWTGLAMSPAVVSVFPSLVNLLGGPQSARTIHFFVAASLVIFVLIHVTMVYLTGFRNHMSAMITGHGTNRKGDT